MANALRENLAAILAKLDHGSRPEEIAEARAQTAAKEATLDAGQGRSTRATRSWKRRPGPSASKTSMKYAAQLAVAEADARSAYQSQRLSRSARAGRTSMPPRALLAQQAPSSFRSSASWPIATWWRRATAPSSRASREIGAIVQAGETVFTLTLTSPVWVRTYVNEHDLGFIRPGMPASVTTDSAPDRPYSAHIGFISPTAEFTPKTVETREIRTSLVYRLRMVVDNPDGGLRQGMPVTVGARLPHPQRDALGAAARWGREMTRRIPDRGRGPHQAVQPTAAPAIDRLSTRVEPGQVTGMVGPDGAGKTTLLRLFAGLLLPGTARLSVCGADTRTQLDRDPRAGQLHAAAVRAVRGPVGAAKPRTSTPTCATWSASSGRRL